MIGTVIDRAPVTPRHRRYRIGQIIDDLCIERRSRTNIVETDIKVNAVTGAGVGPIPYLVDRKIGLGLDNDIGEITAGIAARPRDARLIIKINRAQSRINLATDGDH